MRTTLSRNGSRGDRGSRDGEVLAVVRHVLLGPQSPYQLEKLLRTGVALRLIALAVSVRGEIVLARDDVDQQAPAAELVEGARGGCEVRGLPVPRADCGQRLEGRRPRSEGGRDGESIRPAPSGAEQRTGPPVVLGEPRQLGQPLDAVVPLDGIVPAMAGSNLVRDVPEQSHT